METRFTGISKGNLPMVNIGETSEITENTSRSKSMQKWQSYNEEENLKDQIFQIESRDVEFVLLVYKGDRNTHDYWQDSLEMAMDCAEGEFGVPVNSWELIKL